MHASLTSRELLQAVMTDPVVGPSGRAYERAAIEEWLSRSDRDPLDGTPLALVDLRASEEIARAASEWQFSTLLRWQRSR